ncbi:MAG: metal ABC transporter substrate-binding protein [Mariniblastus sp.]
MIDKRAVPIRDNKMILIFPRGRWANPAALMIACFAILSMGCEGQKKPAAFSTPKPPAPLKNKVVVVSYPLQFLTSQVVGDEVEVLFPAGDAEADARSWRPDRESIGQMQAADLIIANGTPAPYAKWLDRVSLPESKVLNTATKGMLLRDYISVEDVTVTHAHGPEGEHSHAMMVSRTWLDPAMAKKQISFVTEKLISIYPASSDMLSENLNSLTAKLDELVTLAEEIKTQGPPAVLTATPELKYLTRAVGMADYHMAWDGELTIDLAEKDLDKILKQFDEKSRPKIMLFADQGPSSEIREILDTHEIQVETMAMSDGRPAFGNYLTELRGNLEKLAALANSK